MTAPQGSSVRPLPLHQHHAQKGARFGVFGDWEVPLYYTSILEEHEAVRRRAGLFDISHMGEFFFRGPTAEKFLDDLLPRRIARMKPGQALYMPLLNEAGGMVDDVIIYRLGLDGFLMIVNAGNVAKDFHWILSRVPEGVRFSNESDAFGLLALQGPASPVILGEAFRIPELASMGYYHFMEFRNGIIARTGYTGEDGFEIMAPQKELPEIWETLLEAGEKAGLAPAGFGARDTLRLEAAMLLYGHDMDEDTTPLEAGISWAVDLTKEAFVGREPLVAQKKEGVSRRLIGLEMMDRGIPREDYEIKRGGNLIGTVTSGSFATTLQKNIGLGYVSADQATIGNDVEVIIREKPLKAKIVSLPFYKRKK